MQIIDFGSAQFEHLPIGFYQLIDQNGTSDDIHLFNEKLREWEDYYNYHLPHGALQGRTAYERLIEKFGADVSQGS